METNARPCARCWSALPDVVVLGDGDWPLWLRVTVMLESERPTCSCGGAVHRYGVREFVLVDLAVFGRPTRLMAQATLAMHEPWPPLVRRGTRDRLIPLPVDDASSSLGEVTGRPPRPRCRRRGA